LILYFLLHSRIYDVGSPTPRLHSNKVLCFEN